MPSTSKKQHNFMAAVANNPKFAKQVDVPQSVGKEFIKADKKVSTGTRADIQTVNKPKTNHGNTALFNKGGTMKKMNPGMMAIMAMKKPAKKMAAGGKMPMKDGKPAFLNDGKGMKKGGMAMKTPAKKMAVGGAAKKMAKC